MNNLGIIGCGGHAKAVKWITDSYDYDKVIFYDEEVNNCINNFNESISYKFSDYEKLKQVDEFIIAIGNNKIRKKYFDILTKEKFKITTLIHPTSIISKQAKIGKGVVIMPNAVIGQYAEIGDGVIVNTSVVIEHDAKIGNFSHIAPNATLCGEVVINELCLIGASSVLIPGITVNSNSTIGAGSTVVKDVKKNSTFYGS